MKSWATTADTNGFTEIESEIEENRSQVKFEESEFRMYEQSELGELFEHWYTMSVSSNIQTKW